MAIVVRFLRLSANLTLTRVHAEIKLRMHTKANTDNCFFILELANFSASPLRPPLPPIPSDINVSVRTIRPPPQSIPSSSTGSTLSKPDSRAPALPPTRPSTPELGPGVLDTAVPSKPLPKIVSQTSRSVPAVGTPHNRPVPPGPRSISEGFAMPFRREEAPDLLDPGSELHVSPRLADNVVSKGSRVEGLAAPVKTLAAPVAEVMKSIEPVAQALQRLSRVSG